jgi:hypothetical protein
MGEVTTIGTKQIVWPFYGSPSTYAATIYATRLKFGRRRGSRKIGMAGRLRVTLITALRDGHDSRLTIYHSSVHALYRPMTMLTI